MPTVRTTLDPEHDLVVDERTAYDLRQQGLLVDDDAAPEQDPSAPTTEQPDADKAREDRNAARRDELGEDKSKDQPKAKNQAKTNERS